MVAFPPKRRSFITVPQGLKKTEPIASPLGFSLVTSHIYTKIALFFENTNNDPTYMNPDYVLKNLTKALDYYYPLTGRLIKRENGRYDIGHFEKGALFEVVESADDFQYFKRMNFSYNAVPYDELISISNYVSRDSPLFGAKLTYTKCGSLIFCMSWHHKVVDGWCLTRFLNLFARIGRGEQIQDDEIHMWTDAEREPVKPLSGINHQQLYPSYAGGNLPLPTIDMGPSKRYIFTFEKEVLLKMKKAVIEQANDPDTELSMFQVLASFLHRAVIKSRKRSADTCADLICIVSKQHEHPDENMFKYFGNYIMPVPTPNTVKQVMEKSIFQIAKELKNSTRAVTIPYMESLEHYFNTSGNVESIMGPVYRLTQGAVGISDWSRFVDNYDLGYGPYLRLRSVVDSSPLALITIMPFQADTVEVIIQLDSKSMDRLVHDRDFMAFVKAIH